MIKVNILTNIYFSAYPPQYACILISPLSDLSILMVGIIKLLHIFVGNIVFIQIRYKPPNL